MEASLRDYYTKHAPHLVSKAGDILRRFCGREEELASKLRSKYGSSIVLFVASVPDYDANGTKIADSSKLVDKSTTNTNLLPIPIPTFTISNTSNTSKPLPVVQKSNKHRSHLGKNPIFLKRLRKKYVSQSGYFGWPPEPSDEPGELARDVEMTDILHFSSGVVKGSKVVHWQQVEVSIHNYYCVCKPCVVNLGGCTRQQIENRRNAGQQNKRGGCWRCDEGIVLSQHEQNNVSASASRIFVKWVRHNSPGMYARMYVEKILHFVSFQSFF